MRQANSYFDSNFRLRVDYVTGYRAWGLLLYGTLPSSLAALGILKIPSVTTELVLPFGIILAIAPLMAMLLLVRQRLSAWYLMEDLLWVRSLFLAFAILLLSSAVSMSAGFVRGDYSYSNVLWTPVIESFLLGIVVLVASSALFITAIKESGGLPAIPSVQQVSDLNDLRQSMIFLQNHGIWDAAVDSDELLAKVESAIKISEKFRLQRSNSTGNQKFYRQLGKQLKRFDDAVKEVKGDSGQHGLYFPEKIEKDLNLEQRQTREAVQLLHGIRVNA